MSYRYTSILALGVLGFLLSACDSGSSTTQAPGYASEFPDSSAPARMDHPPGEREILNAVRATGCELVAIQKVKWPDDSYRIPADYSDAQVLYDVDCKAEGGDRVYRITFEAQFAAVSSRSAGDSKRVWELKLNQPALQSEATPRPSGLAGSDASAGGPECNALMEQVRTQVLPCVERIDPVAAQRVRSWLTHASRQEQWVGSSGNREFDRMATDNQCRQSWETNMTPDFRGSSPFKECAPR